jgi:AcrR family transcriptional regulator
MATKSTRSAARATAPTRAPSARDVRDAARKVASAASAHRCDCTAVLDAAEKVVVRDGIGRLTLEAVAREAKLSKSGLLHHFPSKEAMIDALVRRTIDDWVSDTAESYAATEAGRGRAVRAILSTCLSSTDQWTDSMRRGSVVLVAALVHDPKHVEPLRKATRLMLDRFDGDGLPAGVGDLVHLAVNGIWFDWIFRLSDWTPQRLTAVRNAIRHLLDHPPAPPKRTKPATRSRRAASAGKKNA